MTSMNLSFQLQPVLQKLYDIGIVLYYNML